MNKQRRRLFSIEDQASQLKQPPSLNEQQTHHHTRITECLFLFPHPPHRFIVRIAEDSFSSLPYSSFVCFVYTRHGRFFKEGDAAALGRALR
jgi:hypothetical protein